MSRNLSIGIASIGMAVGLIQAAAVWGVTSIFSAGLGFFGAGILPTAATGWSPYLAANLKKKLSAMLDEDEE